MARDGQFGRDDFGRGGLNEQVDGNELVQEIGLDRAEIDWRKDFIGFNDEDVRRLESYQDLFSAHAEQVAEDFYENLTASDDTTEVIGRSSKSVSQLKRTQSAYLVTLVQGEYGLEYFRDRARIGKLHDILDMPMKHYIGQYGVYYDLILPLIGDRLTNALVDRLTTSLTGGDVIASDDSPIAEDGNDDPQSVDGMTRESLEMAIEDEVDDSIRDILAILRIINLDMQAVTDTYIHSYSQDLETQLQRQQEVADEVDTAVTEAEQTAEDIASSTEEISSVARSQAEATQEVSSEVADLSATVEEIASTADEVAQTSERGASLAADGREAAEEAIDTMERIDDTACDVADDVARLENRIDEIDEVVEVINGIAEQTNMLALNASIEAARAGEAGDGFAVVANEVKSLAEESQNHAADIEQMVAAIKDDVKETVQNLEETTEEVYQGKDAVENTVANLREIAVAVEEASQGIQEVSEATDDQAVSAERITNMIDELVDQADQVADEIESIAAANEQQANKVIDISQTVDRLTTDGDDRHGV